MRRRIHRWAHLDQRLLPRRGRRPLRRHRRRRRLRQLDPARRRVDVRTGHLRLHHRAGVRAELPAHHPPPRPAAQHRRHRRRRPRRSRRHPDGRARRAERRLRRRRLRGCRHHQPRPGRDRRLHAGPLRRRRVRQAGCRAGGRLLAHLSAGRARSASDLLGAAPSGPGQAPPPGRADGAGRRRRRCHPARAGRAAEPSRRVRTRLPQGQADRRRPRLRDPEGRPDHLERQARRCGAPRSRWSAR